MVKEFGPQCLQCGYKNKIDEFCSEAWMQIEPYNDKGHSILWICSDCICKSRVCKELEQACKLREELIKNIDNNLVSFSDLLNSAKARKNGASWE